MTKRNPNFAEEVDALYAQLRDAVRGQRQHVAQAAVDRLAGNVRAHIVDSRREAHIKYAI